MIGRGTTRSKENHQRGGERTVHAAERCKGEKEWSQRRKQQGHRGEQNAPETREPETAGGRMLSETRGPAPPINPAGDKQEEGDGDSGGGGGGHGGGDDKPGKEKISFLFNNCQSLQN